MTQAFRRLARKRHPDKGGNKEDFQRLRAVPCLVFFAISLKIDWFFMILHGYVFFNFLYSSNYIVFVLRFSMFFPMRDGTKAYELLTTAGIPEVDAPVPWVEPKGAHLIFLLISKVGCKKTLQICDPSGILRLKPPSKLGKLHLRQQILLQRCGRRPVSGWRCRAGVLRTADVLDFVNIPRSLCFFLSGWLRVLGIGPRQYLTVHRWMMKCLEWFACGSCPNTNIQT